MQITRARTVRPRGGSVTPMEEKNKCGLLPLLSGSFIGCFVGNKTLISASEIDRLKGRVEELEKELKAMRFSPKISKGMTDNDNIPIKQEEVLPDELDPLSQHGGHRKYYNWDFATRNIRPGSNQTYGPSSNYYFINQLGSYLDTILLEKEPPSNDQLQHQTSTARKLSSALEGREPSTMEVESSVQDLPRAEEEQMLALYWNSWNNIFPILVEDHFNTHYESLWQGQAVMRYPSALVDIVLALCLQHHAVLQAAKGNSHAKQPTDCTDGWWFYRRCQYLLQDDMEHPTVTTFQCHLLTVIWLSQASWLNAAHNLLAAGLRIGVILGLHAEPAADLPLECQQGRRRLWWTMYTLEAQFAMDTGRPLGVHFSQVTCSLPKKDAITMKKNLAKSLPLLFNEQYVVQ